MATELLYADSLASGTLPGYLNSFGAPDNTWTTNSGGTSNSWTCRWNMDDPAGGAPVGQQQITVWVRPSNFTNNRSRDPGLVVQVYSGGSLIVAGIDTSLVSSSTAAQEFSFTFDASLIASLPLQVQVSSTAQGSNTRSYPNVQVDAITWTANVSETPTPSGPSEPLNVTATPGNGQVIVEWDPPADSGTAPLSDYVLSWRPSGGSWTSLSSSSPSTISGLSNDTEHEVRVAAVNAVGQGPWSASAYATPTAPAVPTGPFISELHDDFNDNVRNSSMWQNANGIHAEVGGRARVSATPSQSWSGYQSTPTYVLDRTPWIELATPAALNGATSATNTLMLFSPANPAGTDVSMQHNAVNGTLQMMDRTGYWESGDTSIPWDPVAHRWWRVRRDGNLLVWETAPDDGGRPGESVVRRTKEFPAHLSGDTVRMELAIYWVGTDPAGSYVEWDMEDIPPPSDPELEDPVLQETIFQLVGTAENSSLDWWRQYGYVEKLPYDWIMRGFTSGICGFTTGTKDATRVVARYAELSPGNTFSGDFLTVLQQIDSYSDDATRGEYSVLLLEPMDWEGRWRREARRSLFREAQKRIRDELYWLPALYAATEDEVSPLGLLNYYDCCLNHGAGPLDGSWPGTFGYCRQVALQTALPPSMGGDEAAWLHALLDARWVVLGEWGDANPNGRIPALRGLVSDGRFDLTAPPTLSWTMYGTAFSITSPPAPFPEPDTTAPVWVRTPAGWAAHPYAADWLWVRVSGGWSPLP